MKACRRHRALLLLACSAVALSAPVAQAQQAGPAKTTKKANAQAQGVRPAKDANARIESLQQQVEALRQRVTEQEARYRELQRTLSQEGRSAPGGESTQAADAAPAAPREAPDDASRPVRVGVAPSAELPAPPVVPLFDQPGILTPRGKYVLEPSLQYGYSSSNRVALVGYTIIPALLIGLIDVREVKRNTAIAALSGRWGVTNRLELEAKLPYVYRSDATVSREIFTGTASESVFDSKGKGLGDVELGARYQLNEPQGNSPYYIGTLRYKARTGKDPFEVVTDCVTRCVGNATGTGLPLDLPTGTGFNSLQAGLTGLFPTDPAVFFGSISYTQNFGRSDISRRVLNDQQEFIGSVKPGNVWSVNFGMGLAINDRSSFSIGADLHSIGRTKQNGVPVAGSVRTQLSSLQLGYSYRYSDRTTLNVTVGAGLTRDTPDLTLTVRIPMTF